MTWFPIRFVPAETRLHFIRCRLLTFFLSALMVAGSLGLVLTKGLNLGFDFTGGVHMELRMKQPADLATLRGIVSDRAFGEITLQNFNDGHDVLVRIQVHEENRSRAISSVKAALDAELGEVEYRRVEYIEPVTGQTWVRTGSTALILALAGMLVYVWFRFEWQYGIGSVAALVHDTIVLMGFYSLTGLDFNLSSVAAVLTVIGYSMNDCIAVYDRIRENIRKFKKRSFNELLEASLNETLSRTVLTGGTTLLALGALAIWGQGMIRDFALATGFGVIIGTYSSAYIAAPVLGYLRVREKNGEELAGETL